MPYLIVYFGDVSSGLKTGAFDTVDFNATSSYTPAEQSVVDAYGGSKSVNDIYGTLKKEGNYDETEFRGVQTAYGKPIFYHLKKDNTTTAVVCAPKLSRGYHYTFAYKARVDMGTGSTFIYPDSSQYHYSSGSRKSFLSSPVVSVWKQPITADTFLYESGLKGTIDATSGLTVASGPAGTDGLTALKTYSPGTDGLVMMGSYAGVSSYPLNDFF